MKAAELKELQMLLEKILRAEGIAEDRVRSLAAETTRETKWFINKKFPPAKKPKPSTNAA